MAGKWTAGSRQQKLRVPKRMLYNAQWEAWVAVAETQLLIGAYDRKFEKRDVKTKGEVRPEFSSRHNLRALTQFYNNSLSGQVMESRLSKLVQNNPYQKTGKI